MSPETQKALADLFVYLTQMSPDEIPGVQDKMIELGLVRSTVYDAVKHGWPEGSDRPDWEGWIMLTELAAEVFACANHADSGQ